MAIVGSSLWLPVQIGTRHGHCRWPWICLRGKALLKLPQSTEMAWDIWMVVGGVVRGGRASAFPIMLCGFHPLKYRIIPLLGARNNIRWMQLPFSGCLGCQIGP